MALTDSDLSELLYALRAGATSTSAPSVELVLQAVIEVEATEE